jgi:aspartyl-tRNA(Asn)/glutamyl-tRNA(Gln) amidotransferase subunit A
MILGGPGTDTGGSIRGPAALCGIAGLKPTYGLVSRAGVAPAAYSLDHIGPMAWTVEDCAILLQAMAGHDPADPASARRPVPDYMAGLRGGVAGLRVGVIHHFHEVDYPVTEATRGGIDTAIATLRDLGAVIQETTLSPLADWSACGTLISITERAAAYEPWMRERLSEFSSVLRDRLMLSSMVSAVDYVQALRRRRELCLELALAMANVDILLTATQRAEAPLIDAISRWDNIERPNFTMPFNVAGVPAISVCSGFGAGDLPVAVQMIAKPFQEALLLRAAHAYEQAAGWRGRRPSLAKAVLAA